MSEEKKEVLEEKKEEVKEVELTPIELKAKEQGWLPKEEWAGNEDDWRPAKEYVERGELFGKIDDQSKELKQLRKVLDTLKDHHLKVKQEAMEDAVKLLKKQRDGAKEEQDLAKVMEITEEIDVLKAKQEREIRKAQEELATPQSTGPTPAFVDWHKNNRWYNPNGKDALSTFANVEADRYMFEHKSATQEQMLAHVSQRAKEEFPDKFTKIVQKVEGGAGRGTPLKATEPVLTEQETKIMNTLVKSGTMTKEQYLKEIKKYEESHR